jgi:FAD binding domain/Berberine and berberine like
MNTIVKNLKEAYDNKKVAVPRMLTNCSEGQDKLDYDTARQVFNTKFQFLPAVIIMCETSEQISVAVTYTSQNALTLRVRSGGHDHEGECSGTDTILLNLTKMNNVKTENGLAYIQPGITFQSLTTQLAEKDVMIPHGTCATVCIAGFTLGGGWGPWTRKHGMCCESVVGATIVLGDGTIKKISQKDEKDLKGLLWAIKGGGGFSYGIVTEFVIQTFELPPVIMRFQIEWNEYKYMSKLAHFTVEQTTPTIHILSNWERVIAQTGGLFDKLVGTNLKISARTQTYDEIFDANTVCNNAIMYGYWEGDKESLDKFVKEQFANTGTYKMSLIKPIGGSLHKSTKYGDNLMSSWDRFSFHNIKLLMQGLEGTPFPPDLEDPSPHKITSRLVNSTGLGMEGHKQLLQSLSSPLVMKGDRHLGLFTYITLGAITGKYYQEISKEQKQRSAFPYKDRLYTIQYQTWWNENDTQKGKGENNMVYNRVNRALDWMEVCRNFDIPNTSGAFISFKDSSIPTKTYFDTSYSDLVKAKESHSKDPYNHFRSRKTII